LGLEAFTKRKVSYVTKDDVTFVYCGCIWKVLGAGVSQRSRVGPCARISPVI